MPLGILLRARRLLPVVLALVVATVSTAVVVSRASGSSAVTCESRAEAAAERRALDTGHGAPVVVIGDSYSVGLEVEPLQSWPTRLPGRVHVDGFSGSGFSADASPCGAGVSYAGRAAQALAGHDDALVVVQGGLNDHRRSDAEIARGYEALLRGLVGYRVLVVGPPPAPSRAAEVPRVDAVLKRMSVGFGVDYLSMADADLDYLDDRLHLTPEGHREFGDLVAQHINARP
ncbi:SGNH/GDSL hydrolase family protein [Nocardioides sp. C4-1]|uniref:SGNH/GDSL hydrolase family protein n=1 Tax=Nocardioides sp. C4-1 TaxID=3151851 RepID=UPI00326586A8